jgi:hypothetical protein
MSNLQQGWITIDSVIKDYLDESEQSNHKYFKCFNIAFRGMEQLGLDFFYNIKSVKLPVNPNQTVALPLDYVNYTKVGVFNDIGEVIPLTYNSKLTTFADLFPDRFDKITDNTLYSYYSPQNAIFYNYFSGAGYGNVYGLPSGAPFVGNFKIDAQNSLILLNDSFYYKYIILEYIASPTEGEEYFVPVQFREALLAYIAWRDIANVPSSRKGSLGDKRDRRSEFYNERRLAQARFRPFYLDAAYQLNLESQRLTVKA